MAKKHRHQVASEWCTYHDGRERHDLRKPRSSLDVGLGVVVEKQYRHLYPAGNKGACCTEERTALCIYGAVTTARDLSRLGKKLAELQYRVEPVVRRD